MSAEMLAQVKAVVIMEREKEKEKQKEELKDYVEMSRKASIELRKSKFKEPQDKRAVGFISELRYDVEDFESSFKDLLDDNKELVDLNENKEKVRQFLKSCVTFGHKLNKKLEREYEAYKVANNSSLGWGTEKYYRQGAFFEDSLKDNNSWLEKDEVESAEDKLKRFRNAERQAKMAAKDRTKSTKKFYQRGGRRRNRWDGAAASGYSTPSSSAAGGPSSFAYKFGPQQLYQPPHSNPVQCYHCDGFGHYKKNCPKLKRN